MTVAIRNSAHEAATKRAVSVRQLIEWAFQREKVGIDFDEIERETGAKPGVGMEYILMEQARLGCRVQGGGTSPSHHDADIVASTLAVLPESCGGRRMAIWIAELARAGRVPEWRAELRVSPVATTTNRHGTRARTSDAAQLGAMGWPHQARRKRNGSIAMEPVLYCPIDIRPTAREIAAMRRGYLQWWSALLEIKSALQISHLTSHVVTNAMPSSAPWKKTA
ncbi:hypothetical protein [Epibacterium sp. Ofav1-8]|uniref:hypothetical protein n=1 Tax=Epibacterium sp. Ofav1-8 TaxID=2917735 RepID=UPI001EF43547|nr:hypothetical protein [Epibacterium sp. Ofav1-8]MCG7623194.1 hypothetical protein [Epibacterium sp. Ofav1-8]